jgi:hypothetical protein
MIMECRKCGAELHEEERVCARCGTPTPRGGGFYVEDESKWLPSPKMLKIAAAVVVALLLIFITYNVLHVTPPETIARKWLGFMVGRQIGPASKLITEECQRDLTTRLLDLRALSDEYVTLVMNDQAKYTLSKPTYSDHTHSTITINFTGINGEQLKTVTVEMIKQGRRWLVNRVV